MEIRTERVSDYDEVFQLNYLAFENREYESKLVERIRLSEPI
jgi:predicted N-acetyltransferase YhbS